MKRVGKTAMLGSLPPLRALSSYCLALALAMAEHGEVEFISFKEIYPRMLYPGGDLRDDPTFPAMDAPALTVRRNPTWRNPLTWISEGLFTKAPLFSLKLVAQLDQIACIVH